MACTWSPTARVVLQGLVSRDDLNGLEGVVLKDRTKDRYAVKISRSGESILVKPQNLGPAPALMDSLGEDALLACFLRLPPASAVRARLVSTSCRDAITAMLGMATWQATHLPAAALCRARAWDGVLQRLAVMPHEANWSLAQVLSRAAEAAIAAGAAEGPYPEREYPLLYTPTSISEYQHRDDDERHESPLALAVWHGASVEVLRALLGARPAPANPAEVGAKMEVQGCESDCSFPCFSCPWEACTIAEQVAITLTLTLILTLAPALTLTLILTLTLTPT